MKVMGKMGLVKNLSANFPPAKLPIVKPKRITPIIEVQVYMELPIIGATILEATSSTTMREKPVISDAIT